jgi:putative transposase
MNLVSDYAAEGISFRISVCLLDIPRSSFYSRPVVSPKSGGRNRSSFTARIGSSTVEIVPNTELVLEIQKTLSMEFVCYGYREMTFHLHRLGYMVNAKNVRRLMSEVHLLNHRYNEHRPVKRVVAASVVVKAPNMVWELDIKYVYVQGEGRNVFLLCFEDCYTREIVVSSASLHRQ